MMTGFKCRRMEEKRALEHLIAKAVANPSKGILIAVAKGLLRFGGYVEYPDMFGGWFIEAGYHEDSMEYVVVSPTWDRWHVRWGGVYKDRY